MNPRAKDIILGVRDRLSCILMTSILQDRVSRSVQDFVETKADSSDIGHLLRVHQPGGNCQQFIPREKRTRPEAL